jgi:hypothetical protein
VCGVLILAGDYRETMLAICGNGTGRLGRAYLVTLLLVSKVVLTLGFVREKESSFA